MKIATDIAEMERVLGGLLDEHSVSEQFKVLRAFRAVLFLTVEDLCTVRNVPRPMLLNHLFSRAGDALLSPYKVSNSNLKVSHLTHEYDSPVWSWIGKCQFSLLIGVE